MPSRADLVATPMQRVAVVAPASRWSVVLREVADRGVFEPDGPVAADADPAVVATGPSVQAVGRCRLLPGWTRCEDEAALRAAIDPLGGAVADLPGRPGLLPPTSYPEERTGAAFRPLVTTYATVPYRDLDPTLFAVVAYMVMFGMMFGDVAHGLAIVAVGLVAIARRADGALRTAAPFLIGAGLSATLFGLLYGEAFGPTGLVPTLWIRPLDEPETLLVSGLLLGGVLMAITFAVATVNRWREGGARLAVYASSGAAGAIVLVGIALLGGSALLDRPAWQTPGFVLIAIGSALVFVGLVGARGSGGIAQAVVELFDTLLRLGSNIVSFTRLAAFGLTHAVITEVVWNGTVGLWDRGTLLAAVGAAVLFAGGNAAAFALGALVGAIQALRLEYYELFSRLFVTSGRPFSPWHVPARRRESP